MEFYLFYFYNTPLHFATRGSNVLIVQALISCGAKIGIQNNSKETPLSSAKQSRNQEIKDYLIGISTKKIKRPSLDELVKKYLPILDGEEEEEEDKTDEGQGSNSIINNSNSTDIKEISKDLGKGAKEISSIYRSLKDIEDRINVVKDTTQIVDLNSKKYPDKSTINIPNEEDSNLNNLCKYINDLSGKINYIEHKLFISKNDDDEGEENDEADQKQKNKEDNQIKKEPQSKMSISDFDKEPLQDEIKSSFPFFKSKNRCHYCGSQRCHLCSECRHFICPICTKSILHINDDQK